MKDFIRSEEGSILPMFAVAVTLLIMIAAVAIDYSRYTLASEKLQTATDSAAAAAAMTGQRYVELLIDPGEKSDTCHKPKYNSEGEKIGETSYPCCKFCKGPFKVSGLESDLVDNEGYKRYFCSCNNGSAEVLTRWVEYEDNGSDARAAAQAFFDINKPKEMDGSTGGHSEITSIDVYNDRSSPLYPSVVVHSQGKLKTLMMNFLDKMYPGTHASELGASRCAQGGTFYYDPNGKLHRAAEEGCN